MHDYKLSGGPHDKREDGMCAMEWAAYIAGEEHSWRPQCVSPELAQFAVSMNDSLALLGKDEWLQRMRPYIVRMIGTNGDGNAYARRRRIAGFFGVKESAAFSTCGVLLGVASTEMWKVVQTNPRILFNLLDELLPLVPVQVPVLVDEAKALTEATA